MAVGVATAVTARRNAAVTPWQVLVRMKVASLRHALRDQNKIFWIIAGVVIGLGLAGATVWAAISSPDLVAVALALWMLGWIVGPLFTGGGDESLRPEYFAMLPLPRRTLAAGLVAAAFVGFAAVIALVALASVVVVGARISVVAAVIGVLGAVLELACFVLASKVAVAGYGLLLRVRAGAAAAGVVNAFILAFTAQGWALIAAFVSHDVEGVLAGAARVAPSGWALVSVEAAGRGEWLLAIGALAGLGGLAVALFAGWTALLARWRSADRHGVTPRHPLTAHDARGAASAKELRTWSRDLLHFHRIVFAIAYGLAFCLMPLAVGWAGMAPWAGCAAAVMGGAMTANMYASDGTALWLTLLVPGSARIDVRARQRAFLLVLAPPVVLLSALLTWWSGERWAWPLVLSAVPAVLGAAAGVSVLLSVVMAVPGTDAHKRGGNPLDGGDSGGETMGQVYAALGLIVAITLPAVGAALLWGWWGLAVGVAVGVGAWWGLGAIASIRLQRRGVELLVLLRNGRPPEGPQQSGSFETRMKALPPVRRVVVGVCIALGAIPLFPQGIVPVIFLSSGIEAKAWFLAMYVPSPWQWPVALGMILLGLAMYAVVASVFWRPLPDHGGSALSGSVGEDVQDPSPRR